MSSTERVATTRNAAIDELLSALERMIDKYPPTSTYRGDDAECITGEIAQHLTYARARLAAAPRPAPVPVPVPVPHGASATTAEPY
ncbi:MAG TPA: hypothetical protein VFE65_18710 [Pseudonocardia sp.]|jgi:hypothetical protein|nr:hypothetical protein [Pseudonocardia sp.]